MSDSNRVARSASDEEQRVKAITDRALRETFKNRMPAGAYTGFLWDGMKIVGAAAGGVQVDAVYTMTTTNTVLGDATPKRLNFNHQEHDPKGQVTTGASWAFTAASAGMYLVWVSAPLSISLTNWVAADRADLTIQGAVSKSLCTWVGIPVTAEPSNILLSGWRGFALAQGDVIYAQVVQDSGTDFDIDEALATIIVGHV
jgi:hypothetical protein